jgi:hypothetical protein
VDDDGSIDKDGYSYTTLKDAAKLEQGKIITVKGVVISIEDMDEITMRSGMTKPIRRIIIADNSKDNGLSMQITFWGKIAYRANFEKGEIIACKDAKVGKYNGVSLNMSDECEMKKLKEERDLRKWFESLTNIKEITPLSEQNRNRFKTNEAGMKPEMIADILEKVKEDVEELTNPNYIIEANLVFIVKADNMVYMACPEDKKRMTKDFDRDEFYCER